MIAKLTKLKIPELNVLQYALTDYKNYLMELIHKYQTTSDTKIHLSIATELWKEIDKKLNKDFLPTNTTLKLPYHRATVFVAALLHYSNSLATDSYEAALLTRYTNTLLPNIN